MNAVFWFLVIVVLGLVWLCLAFAFGKIGSVAWRLIKDAKDEIEKEYPEEYPDDEDNFIEFINIQDQDMED